VINPIQRRFRLTTDAIDALTGMKRGIEKESLRVTPQGTLAQTLHPLKLGAALTHPSITTDFSESLLELITGPHTSIDSLIEELYDIHQYVYEVLTDELLWVNSMPCAIQREEEIPIATYGSSHLGQLKHIYRHGLANRYGRRMQAIAGIHFNLSYSDVFWQCLHRQQASSQPLQQFISENYFNIIRNFQRFSWILAYFLGASPFVPKHLMSCELPELDCFDQDACVGKTATSLRLSDTGYNNRAQNKLTVCYNTLPTYLATLKKALQTPHPEFQALGITDSEGYKQLNDRFLQIENEYYSPIRPKRIGQKGERPLIALEQYGVEYIEVRTIDLNPLEPIGIDKASIQFLDIFLLTCLSIESPLLNSADFTTIRANMQAVAVNGCDVTQPLSIFGKTTSQNLWLEWFFAQMQESAIDLDQAYGGQAYSNVMGQFHSRLLNTELLPSQQLKAALEHHTDSTEHRFLDFTRKQSEQTKAFFQKRKQQFPQKAREVSEKFSQLAKESIAKQQALEKQSKESEFSTYLADYLAFD